MAVAEPDRAPDLRVVLTGINAGWRREAACQGEERLFLSERGLGFRKNVGSPKVTLALLICSTCPVRRDCLAESLTPIEVDLDATSNESVRPRVTVRVDGIWGGSTAIDRWSVSGLPRDRALARLERTFAARLRHQAQPSAAGCWRRPDERSSWTAAS